MVLVLAKVVSLSGQKRLERSISAVAVAQVAILTLQETEIPSVEQVVLVEDLSFLAHDTYKSMGASWRTVLMELTQLDMLPVAGAEAREVPF